MTEFDLRALIQALTGRDIAYIVIGGVAVGAQGFVRATEDLDIVPDPDPDNLGRLVEALVDLDATLPTAEDRPFDRSGDGAAVRQGANVSADTKFGPLDVVQLADGVPGYSLLDEDADSTEIDGVPVRVCSLKRLRQMKSAQGRAIDLADLESLPEG